MQSENSWGRHQILWRKEQLVDKGNGVDPLVLIGYGIGHRCRISYEKLSRNKVIMQRNLKRTKEWKKAVWGLNFRSKRKDKGIVAIA